MQRILIVEDDLEINRLLADFLKENGYEVFCQYDGLHVSEFLRENRIDLLILDIMLPYRSGDIVLSDIRKHFTTPVIIISAKETTQNKIDLCVWAQMIILRSHLIWKKCLPESRAACAGCGIRAIYRTSYNMKS